MKNNNLKLKIIFLIIITFLLNSLTWTENCLATQYFYFDAENGVVGEYLPNPPFCQTECSGIGEKGTYQSGDGTPQGLKYFQWRTIDNQNSAYTEVSSPNFPLTNILGKTYYLALFFNFSRINGRDIWHECNCQSMDKALDIIGSGVRWTLSFGQWEAAATPQNQDHYFTAWIQNPTYHLNPSIEKVDAYPQNQSGYSTINTIQLRYEQWYSAVVALEMAADNAGSVTLYINGVKILEYKNIKTCANSDSTITHFIMNGTIAQAYYDAPAHLRKFDALILTDNWQDIVDGGYLQDPNISSDTTPPAAPRNLTIL